MKDCTLGDCTLNLDADGLETLRAGVDWRKHTARADANAVFRRLALQYVQDTAKAATPGWPYLVTTIGPRSSPMSSVR